MDMRFRVFTPWADKGRVIPKVISASWVGKLNDHSVLTLEVSQGTISDSLLTGEVEISLEVKTEDAWYEPRGCRFRARTTKADKVKSAATRTVHCIGISDLLNDALVWDATPTDEDGKRIFAAQSPGTMMLTLLNAAKQRQDGGHRWGQGLTWPFANSADAANQPWGKNVSATFPVTATLMKVLNWLVSKGAVDWTMDRRQLLIYRAGGHMARSVNAPLRKAFATAVPIETRYAGLTTSALMLGKDGKRWERNSATPASAFGRVEIPLTQGQVELDATANLYLEEAIKKGEHPAQQYRREWTGPKPGAPIVWKNYDLGDWVPVDGEQMRIVEMGVKIDDKGTISGWETLGTRNESLLEKLARRNANTADGMAGGENSPIILDRPSAKPAKPTGLVASSDGYWEDGRQFSRVQVGWQAVSLDTQGRPLSISHYEVNVAGRLARGEGLSATVDGVGAGVSVRIEVRAVSSDGVLSEPAHITITTARPDERLSPPTRLTASCSDGIVTVSWDGKLKYSNGALVDPPKHFDRVDLYQATGPTGPGVLVGTLTAGSSAFDRTPNIGKTLYFYGVAVDTAGGESDPGQRSSVQVVSSTRAAVAQAQSRADQASLAAEGARETAQVAVVKSDAAGLKAQNAFNRAVAAAAASPNLAPEWTSAWTVGVGITKNSDELVFNAESSGAQYANRFYSSPVSAPGGRMYRLSVVASNAGGPCTVTLGAYLTKSGKYVRSVWPAGHRVSVPAGASRQVGGVDLPLTYGDDTDGMQIASYIHDATGEVTIHSVALVDITALAALTAEVGQVSARVSQVQAAANGKNTITRSTVAPSGNGATSGDVWYRYGTSSLSGTIIGKWIWTGSSWQASTIGHQVIESVTTDKLVAGAGQINTAVINQLVTDSHFAQRMAANAVVVHAAQNLWPGTWGGGLPGGFTGGVGWETGVDDPGDRGAYRLEGTKIVQGAGNLAEVVPGEEYVFEAVVGANKPDSRLYVELRDDKGAHCADCYPLTKGDAHALNGAASSHYAIAGMKVPGSWRTVRVKVIPRAGVTRMQIGKIYPNHASGTVKDAIVWIRCRLYRPVGAVDIRDGAITAPHLTVDQAMINKIVTPELMAGKIETSMFSTQAGFEGPGVRIDRGGVRISGTGQRSVVLNPSQGLQVTDHGGNAVFRADMTGNVVLKGSITAGSTITGATIVGGQIRMESQGRRLFEVSSSGHTTWRAKQGPNGLAIDTAGYRDRVTVMMDSGVSGLNKSSASLFITSSSETYGDNPYDVGAFVITGTEKIINHTGRADLVLGPQSKWRIGVNWGDANWQAALQGERGGITFLAGNSGYRFKKTTSGGSMSFAVEDLPLYSGGIPLAVAEGNSWLIGYQGSARRLKTHIRDVGVDPHALLKVPVRQWIDKFAAEAHAKWCEDRAEGGLNTGQWDDWQTPPGWIPGLVAEEVRDAGLDLYVTYRNTNGESEVSGLMYDRLWTLLIPLVDEALTRISKLERNVDNGSNP